MKYALLVSKTLNNGTISGYKNIGDYVQSLAAAQFMPRIDEYYDKTALDTGTDKIKMIMNAWCIWDPLKFPISERIVPLPISMHISPFCAERLLSLGNVYQWLKRNEPIGCRDRGTEKFLQSKGIDSYFSGCLTLTLGKKYFFSERKSGVVFVDPYIAHLKNEVGIINIFQILVTLLFRIKTILRLKRKFNHNYCLGRFSNIKKLIYSTIFFLTYRHFFSVKTLLEADYITHIVQVGEGTELETEESKVLYAESLVKKYASSELVVTSRIHCALPCLGIETPVIFTLGDAIETKSPLESDGRFDGLLNLFNVIKVHKFSVLPSQIQFPITNKNDYKKLSKKLEETCESFFISDT